MTNPDWREQAYATFDKVMRSFLDNLYKDQIAPAMIEAGMDPARYRLEFAPLNPVEALHAEVMIKGEAYVSLPAEVTTDIAADTENIRVHRPTTRLLPLRIRLPHQNDRTHGRLTRHRSMDTPRRTRPRSRKK